MVNTIFFSVSTVLMTLLKFSCVFFYEALFVPAEEVVAQKWKPYLAISIDATVLILLCEVDDSLITFVALTPFRHLALGLCQEARLELGAFGVVDSLLGGSLRRSKAHVLNGDLVHIFAEELVVLE